MLQDDVLPLGIPEMHDIGRMSVDFPPIENHSQFYQRSILARNILFACEDCDGALIPSAQCVVCKKTSSRICVKCSSKVRLDWHKSCECLILVAFMQTRKSHEVLKTR